MIDAWALDIDCESFRWSINIWKIGLKLYDVNGHPGVRPLMHTWAPVLINSRSPASATTLHSYQNLFAFFFKFATYPFWLMIDGRGDRLSFTFFTEYAIEFTSFLPSGQKLCFYLSQSGQISPTNWATLSLSVSDLIVLDLAYPPLKLK